MRQGIAIAALLAIAAAAWWLWPRADGVPAARDGAGAGDAAGAGPPAEASLKVTTDPKMKVFTRAETLAGTAPETEVRGVVDGPEGAPVGGLRVTARSRMPFRPASTSVTEKDGAFRLQGVDDQLLDVMLGGVPEGWSAPSAIATAGGPALRMRLERRKPKQDSKALPVAITVLDYDGKPVAKARVKVQTSTIADGDATDAEGVARFDVTDPGEDLWFAVERPDGREDVFDMEVEGWKPHDETVRLKRAVKLSGVLQGPMGWGAFVAWRRKDGPWNKVALEADAAFSVSQMEPGPVQLVAFDSAADAPFPPDTRIVEVDPAAGPVSLISSAPSPGWLQVRLGPLEDREIDLVTISRITGPGTVTDAESNWYWGKDGAAIHYRGISRASRYQVYARRSDGKIGFATNVELGDGGKPLELPWTEGKTIRVFVRWHGKEPWHGPPRIAQGVYVDGVTAEDGKPVAKQLFDRPITEFLMQGLPDGTWTVEEWLHRDDEVYGARADVAAGGSTTLQMHKLDETEKARGPPPGR